jgi:cob(I)alamin adenosyltransferase
MRLFHIMSRVKIYTKTGDAGETGLLDGTRVRKSDVRVEVSGTIDELSAWLGVARALIESDALKQVLLRVQRDLFALGAQLADPSRALPGSVQKAAFGSSAVTELERDIDRFEAELPPLRHFVLPGGSPAGAVLHAARTVCRRAERRLVSLLDPTSRPDSLAYVNRLSDLLFVMARVANQQNGASEIEW